MLAKMRATIKTNRQKLHTSQIPVVPLVSATELTKSTWAKLIKSRDQVPDVYLDFFDTHLADGIKFPYTILAPSFERFIHKRTEKLICDCGSEIYVLERVADKYETVCYPLEGIIYVEIKTLLLDSYIRICGETKQGEPTTCTIQFNTVTDYLFKPILDKFRLASFESIQIDECRELEKFDYLARSNFKLMNYAKRSLLGGEKVIQIILQPEIRAVMLTILGRTFYRTVSPKHMCILTDQELIIIRENARRGREDKYGGVWDYIPLNRIAALRLIEIENDLLTFSIQLSGGECLETVFSDTMQGEINQLVLLFGGLNSRGQSQPVSSSQVIDTLI